MIVVAELSLRALAISAVPSLKGLNSYSPSGPFQMIVAELTMIVWNSAIASGPMSRIFWLDGMFEAGCVSVAASLLISVAVIKSFGR